MKTLRVKMPFRDISDFSIRHEVGDVIILADADRVARLLRGGLCEEIVEKQKQEPKPVPEPEPNTADVDSTDADPSIEDSGNDSESELQPVTDSGEDEAGSEDRTPETNAKPASRKGRKSVKKQ